MKKNKIPFIKRTFSIVLTTALAANFCFAQTTAQNISNSNNTSADQPGVAILKSNSASHSLSNALDFLREKYSLSGNENFVLLKSEQDNLGFTHNKYQQLYNDIPVEGRTVTVHARNGKIEHVTGNYIKIEELTTSATLTESACLGYALKKVDAKSYVWENNSEMDIPKGDLVVFTHSKNGKINLAYKFDVYSYQPLYRAYVFVDANSGEILFENSRIHNGNVAASGNTLYNGNRSFTADEVNPTSFRLRQTATGNGIETYSANNLWDYSNTTDITSAASTSWTDATALSAHWGAEQTHGYFMTKHGRNSYDGAGAKIISYVHFGVDYVNAFWNGSVMTYGDGDPLLGIGYGPLVSLDIVGHEIAHGVTTHSANLVYAMESGALNESFSDIFGEAIELYASGSHDWQMGTDIGIGGSGAIRSMDNPNAFGDPDTYGGTFWVNQVGCVPTGGPGGNDYCGVHTNSGVQNKWFYILSEGETGTNDNSDNYSVSGIGIDKAGAIAYRNLTVYLTANSTFADARAGAIQSAIDLYGAGSAEEIATTNAWYAVGVGAEYVAPPVVCSNAISSPFTPDTYAYDGIFFDVNATNDIAINDFIIGYGGSGNGNVISIYSIAGSYVGQSASLASWTLEGTGNINATPMGTYVALNSNVNIAVPAGTTRGILLMITTQPGGDNGGIQCRVSSIPGINASNGDLTWTTGEAIFNGLTLGTDVDVSGSICYDAVVPQCPVTNTFAPMMTSGLYAGAGASDPETYYWGLSSGFIKANPAGGVGPYTYSWSNSAGYAMKGTSNMKARLFYPTGPTWVKVAITDAGAGCTIVDSVYIDWVDYTCNQPDLWFYEMCNINTNTSVCIAGTRNMRDSVKTGNYVFGPCNQPVKTGAIAQGELGVNVFPNPSNGDFTYVVMGEDDAVFNTEILDLNGRVLFAETFTSSSTITSRQISLQSFAAGVYMIKVSSNETSTVERIIIQ